MAKSLEQRLYEAYRNGAGVRLSATDVFDLLRDDAIATRITNQACIEAGVDESGADDVFGQARLSWSALVRQLREDG